MKKALLTVGWKSCCRIIRIIPVLADSGAFVAGVLALLSQFQLNLALGIIIVVLGLVGIDALIKRLERSRTLNSEEEARHQSARKTNATQRVLNASRELNQCQLHTTTSEQQFTQLKIDRFLKVKLAWEKCELRLSLRQRSLNITIGKGNSNGIVVEIQEENEQGA